MTVSDLIAALSRLPPGMPVVIQGSNGGYADLRLDSGSVALMTGDGFGDPHAPDTAGGVPACILAQAVSYDDIAEDAA